MNSVTDPFAGTGGLVPADLTERYLPSEQVEFAVVHQVGAFRLWRATVTRQVDETKLRLCRYHVTRGECGEAFHIKELCRAKAIFAMEMAHG